MATDVCAPIAHHTRGCRTLSPRGNFVWTLAGNMVFSGCQWGILVVLAKLGSPEMIGQFALGLAITAPIFMFTNLQLRAVQATDAAQTYQFGDYLGLRLTAVLLSILIVFGVASWTGERPSKVMVITVVGLMKGIDSVSDIYYGWLQRHECMDRIAKSMMMRGFLAVTGLFLAVWKTGSLLWGLVSVAVAWALVLVVYDLRSGMWMSRRLLWASGGKASRERPRWDRDTLLRLVRLSLPLGLVMMLISANSNFPRYFLERWRGEAELGIFAAVGYLLLAATTVVNALGQSAAPRLANHFCDGEIGAFKRLMFRLLGVGMILGVLGVLAVSLCGRPLLGLLYRPEYAEHADLFLLLAVVVAVTYAASLLGYGMTASRQFCAQAVLFTLVVPVTLVGCTLLIPTYGTLGAGGAMLIGAAVQAVGSAVLLCRRLKKSAVPAPCTS